MRDISTLHQWTATQSVSVLELQEHSRLLCVILSSWPPKGTRKQFNALTWCVLLSRGYCIYPAAWYSLCVLVRYSGKWSCLQWCASIYCLYTTGMYFYHIQHTEVKCNACLNLTKFMQNWTADDVQRLAYTSRQLNTLPEHPLMLFNCVIICTAEQMESVAKSLQQCFNHTEFGYWHNQACSTSGKSPFWIKFCIP